MKLKRLFIKDFLGIENAEVMLEKPVVLIVGENNAGKSTIKDAIEFALTGQVYSRGISKAKDFGKLASGNEMAVAVHFLDEEDEKRTITRDETTGFKRIKDNPFLQVCLNPTKLLEMKSKEIAELVSFVALTGNESLIKKALLENLPEVSEEIHDAITQAGISMFDIDAVRKEVIDFRRLLKRELDAMPKKEPHITDFNLNDDYDTGKVKKRIEKLNESLQKAAEYFAAVKADTERRAKVIDLKNANKRLKASIKKVKESNTADEKKRLEYEFATQTMLDRIIASEEKYATCPCCLEKYHLSKWNRLYSDLKKWLDENPRVNQAQIDTNAEATAKMASNLELIASLEEIKGVQLKPNAIEKRNKLQAESDLLNQQAKNYSDYLEAVKAYAKQGEAKEQKKELIEECNRIDEVLSEDGAVRRYINEHSTQIPLNEELMKLWNADIKLKDNGEILYNRLALNLASDSEKHRAAWILALALAEFSGIGICALDRFEILTLDNQQKLFQTVQICNLNNIFVLMTVDEDSRPEPDAVPDWLDYLHVEKGKVIRLDK